MSAVIPSTWSVRKIGAVAAVNPRRPAELRKLRDDHPVTFVPMSAVDEVAGRVTAAETRAFAEVRKGLTYFAEGDVLFARITPCMQNGKSAIASGLSSELGFGSTEFHVLRPNPSLVCAQWLWYFLRNPEFRQEATHHFRGGVGQQRVPAEFLADHPVPLPPLDEQRRIVGCIRALMDRVEEARRLRAESRKDARHLFAAGLESAFRADWPAARLSDIASEIRNGWSGKEDKEGVEARVLRLSAVHGLTINAAESRPVQLRSADATAFPVRRDEVFVVRGNGSKHLVGRSAIATQDHPGLIFNDLLMRVVPDRTRLRPDFLNYCLHTPSVRRQIEDAAKTAAGIWKINQATLGAVRIPCPDLETQAKTVEVARALHENNQALFQRLEEFPTERLSAAILRKAFSGEL